MRGMRGGRERCWGEKKEERESCEKERVERKEGKDEEGDKVVTDARNDKVSDIVRRNRVEKCLEMFAEIAEKKDDYNKFGVHDGCTN